MEIPEDIKKIAHKKFPYDINNPSKQASDRGIYIWGRIDERNAASTLLPKWRKIENNAKYQGVLLLSVRGSMESAHDEHSGSFFLACGCTHHIPLSELTSLPKEA